MTTSGAKTSAAPSEIPRRLRRVEGFIRAQRRTPLQFRQLVWSIQPARPGRGANETIEIRVPLQLRTRRPIRKLQRTGALHKLAQKRALPPQERSSLLACVRGVLPLARLPTSTIPFHLL